MNASHLSAMPMGAYPMAIARISSREMSMFGGRIATGSLMGETCPQHVVVPIVLGARRPPIASAQHALGWPVGSPQRHAEHALLPRSL